MADFGTLASGIADLKQEVADLKATDTSTAETIALLTQRVADAESAITTLQDDVLDLQNAIAALLPAYTIDDAGDVLTVIDDGEGNPALSWETPGV